MSTPEVPTTIVPTTTVPTPVTYTARNEIDTDTEVSTSNSGTEAVTKPLDGTDEGSVGGSSGDSSVCGVACIALQGLLWVEQYLWWVELY